MPRQCPALGRSAPACRYGSSGLGAVGAQGHQHGHGHISVGITMGIYGGIYIGFYRGMPTGIHMGIVKDPYAP